MLGVSWRTALKEQSDEVARKEYSTKNNKMGLGWVCKVAAAFGMKEDFFLVCIVCDKVVLVLKKTAWVIGFCLAGLKQIGNVLLAKEGMQRAMKY